MSLKSQTPVRVKQMRMLLVFKTQHCLMHLPEEDVTVGRGLSLLPEGFKMKMVTIIPAALLSYSSSKHHKSSPVTGLDL